MDASFKQIKIEVKPSQSFNTMISLVISMGIAAWLGLKVQSWVGFPVQGLFPVLGIIGVFISWLKQSTAEYISQFEERADLAEAKAEKAQKEEHKAKRVTQAWASEIAKIDSLKERNQTLAGEIQSAQKDLQSLKATRQSLEKELASANKKLASAEKNLATAKDEITKCVVAIEQSSKLAEKQVEQSVSKYKQSVLPYLELHKHTQAYFGLWSVTNNRNASQEARSLASADKEQARAHIDSILKEASPVGFKFDPDDYQVELTPIY